MNTFFSLVEHDFPGILSHLAYHILFIKMELSHTRFKGCFFSFKICSASTENPNLKFHSSGEKLVKLRFPPELSTLWLGFSCLNRFYLLEPSHERNRNSFFERQKSKDADQYVCKYAVLPHRLISTFDFPSSIVKSLVSK